MSQKWKCKICNYIEFSDDPPHRCPICRAESSKFLNVPHVAQMEDETFEDYVQTHTSKSMFVSSFDKLVELEESLDGEVLISNAIVVKPVETLNDFFLESESIMVVMSGEGEITSEGIERLFLEITDSDAENTTEESSGNGEENENSESDVGQDKANTPEEMKEDKTNDEPNLWEEIKVAVKEKDIILIPANKALDINNTSESDLLIYVVAQKEHNL